MFEPEELLPRLQVTPYSYSSMLPSLSQLDKLLPRLRVYKTAMSTDEDELELAQYADLNIANSVANISWFLGRLERRTYWLGMSNLPISLCNSVIQSGDLLGVILALTGDVNLRLVCKKLRDTYPSIYIYKTN